MKKTLSISVIIPVYNSSATIDSCLSSLQNQSLQPKEIIVVNDGSTDDTVKKVKSFNQIKLISLTHAGPAAARNLGASKAIGKILVFVDSDMEFDKDFLKILTLPIQTGRAKGTWSNSEWVKNYANVWARCWNYNQGRKDARMISSTKHQKKVFRAILKSEFDKVNGFDQIGYTDDWTLVSKLAYLPKVTTAKFYHYNPDTLPKVFTKARWVGKRQYKLGNLGTLIAIFRANAGFSIIIGIVKSIQSFNPYFLLFKLAYDLGILIGALESFSGKKY